MIQLAQLSWEYFCFYQFCVPAKYTDFHGALYTIRYDKYSFTKNSQRGKFSSLLLPDNLMNTTHTIVIIQVNQIKQFFFDTILQKLL